MGKVAIASSSTLRFTYLMEPEILVIELLYLFVVIMIGT